MQTLRMSSSSWIAYNLSKIESDFVRSLVNGESVFLVASKRTERDVFETKRRV